MRTLLMYCYILCNTYGPSSSTVLSYASQRHMFLKTYVFLVSIFPYTTEGPPTVPFLEVRLSKKCEIAKLMVSIKKRFALTMTIFQRHRDNWWCSNVFLQLIMYKSCHSTSRAIKMFLKTHVNLNKDLK